MAISVSVTGQKEDSGVPAKTGSGRVVWNGVLSSFCLRSETFEEKKAANRSGSSDRLCVEGRGVELTVPRRSESVEYRALDVVESRMTEEKYAVLAEEIIFFTLLRQW